MDTFLYALTIGCMLIFLFGAARRLYFGEPEFDLLVAEKLESKGFRIKQIIEVDSTYREIPFKRSVSLTTRDLESGANEFHFRIKVIDTSENKRTFYARCSYGLLSNPIVELKEI